MSHPTAPNGTMASDPCDLPRTAPLPLALVVALCGALLPVKVVFVGDLHVGEVLLISVALLVLALNGVGRRQTPWFAWVFGMAVFGMLIGYAISDIAVASSPGKYMRGWARVSLLALDFLALLLLVSHSERLLAWFLLGLAWGTLASAFLLGTPFNAVGWKEGYAFPLGILLALWVGRKSPVVAGLFLGAFGVLSLLLDYRGLGGVFLVSGGITFAHAGGAERQYRFLLRSLLVALGIAIAIFLVWVTLAESQTEYLKRREESNIGRYAGLIVAIEAITDSPLIGYGSWATDKTYVQMLKREVERQSAHKQVRVDIGDSILPHSQILQAWVEGGALAGMFFGIYGISLIGGLRWLTFSHRLNQLTPVYTVIIVNGLWDLCVSPFLGMHRIGISCAIAATSILAWEWHARRQKMLLQTIWGATPADGRFASTARK